MENLFIAGYSAMLLVSIGIGIGLSALYVAVGMITLQEWIVRLFFGE